MQKNHQAKRIRHKRVGKVEMTKRLNQNKKKTSENRKISRKKVAKEAKHSKGGNKKYDRHSWLNKQKTQMQHKRRK